MEIVLTKKDLAGLHTTETTIATRENGEWEVWETVKDSPFDTKQLARIKAAIGIIACLEQDTEETLQYVSYVENGKLSKLTFPYNETVPERLERLRGIFSKCTVKSETHAITVTKEDLERVTLHNGLSMRDNPKTTENVTGFTVTDDDGYEHKFTIPEHLKWAVYNQPTTRPTRGSNAPNSSTKTTQTTRKRAHNLSARGRAGRRSRRRRSNTPLARGRLDGTRKEDDLGFSIRHNPLKLDTYAPRNEDLWANIYDTTYEDRTYAVAYLVATIAEEKKITGPVEIGDYPLESVAPDIINLTRRQIDGKTPQQIQEQLTELWYKK